VIQLAAAWLLGAFGGGAALAWLYKRLHPQLAFYKLWALWTTVLGAVVALLLALGFVRL
jgi:predicted lysophospholipase L1 biosynthesis ABC-type transport system permease subunit